MQGLFSTALSYANLFFQALDHQEYKNDYPIILVHGLGGWGRDEFFGFKYWGGFFDIQEYLRNCGYQTHTAVVGPWSSNWDRACDLFACIKGGVADYGKKHSEKYGHRRFGRAYRGLYPQWGEIDPKTGKTRKVHLLTHSMGGQTARTLVQLLENGNREETENTPEGELSPLFDVLNKKSWVHSVTTISTPHDGSTKFDFINETTPFLQQSLGVMAASGGIFINNPVFDFKLDQWDLNRQAHETFDAYFRRVLNSTVWKDTYDISFWDLSTDGAKELNKWVNAQPGVYYFSWASENTAREFYTGFHLPKPGMDFFYLPFSFQMGSYLRNIPGRVVIDESWWKNDGSVNTVSMNGPKLGSRDEIVDYNGTPRKGKWNYMGIRHATDHRDILGVGTFWIPYSWYHDQADLLHSLPE